MKMLIVVCKINLLCLSVNYKLIFPSSPDILLMPQHVMSATKPSLVFVLASDRTVDREGSLFTCNPVFILFKICKFFNCSDDSRFFKVFLSPLFAIAGECSYLERLLLVYARHTHLMIRQSMCSVSDRPDSVMYEKSGNLR